MSESTTANSGLTSQYAAQVTSDLEHNTKEQERIDAEISALQEQLTALQQDHSVLVNVQQALGLSPAPTHSTAASDSAAVSTSRKTASDEPSAGKRTQPKKTATPPGRTKAGKSAPQKPTGKAAAGKPTRPTLVALIHDYLTEQSEPRSAAEVAAALGTAHPERGIKTTVVRTTLEGLVAKNHAQRSKQGASVFYTAPHTAGQTPTPVQGESQSS